MNIIVLMPSSEEEFNNVKIYFPIIVEALSPDSNNIYLLTAKWLLGKLEILLENYIEETKLCEKCKIIVYDDNVNLWDRVKDFLEEKLVLVAVPGSYKLLVGLLNIILEKKPSSLPEIYILEETYEPWKGLSYPYIPATLATLKKGPGKEKYTFKPHLAERYPNIESSCIYNADKTRLSPFRCAIAELSRRMNVALSKAHYNENGLNSRIVLSSDYLGEVVDRILPLHDEERFLQSLEGLVEEVCVFLDGLWSELKNHGRLKTHRRHAFRQLLYISGLVPLHIVQCSGPTCSSKLIGKRIDEMAKPTGKALLVDSNMMYSGIHNIASKDIGILVPYCIFYEISAIYSESVKAYEYGDIFIDLAAYIGLEELIASKTGMLVSSHMAHKCEAVIPMMDPFILSKSIIVTRDVGAYRLWSIHPMLQGTDIVLVDSPSCKEMRERVRELTYNEALYYFLQLVVTLRLLTRGKYFKDNMKFLQLDFEVNGEKVYVPYPRVTLYK